MIRTEHITALQQRNAVDFPFFGHCADAVSPLPEPASAAHRR